MKIQELAIAVLRPRWRPMYYFSNKTDLIHITNIRKIVSKNMFKKFKRESMAPLLKDQAKMYSNFMIQGKHTMFVSGRRSGKSLLKVPKGWQVVKSRI